MPRLCVELSSLDGGVSLGRAGNSPFGGLLLARLPSRVPRILGVPMALMLWLLVKGVSSQRWNEQAGALSPQVLTR